MAKTVEKRGKNIQIERLMLQTLATCGVIAVAVAVPNAIGVLKRLDRNWDTKLSPRRRVSQTLSRLRQKGLVNISNKSGEKRVVLTQKGKNLLQKIDETKFHIRKPIRWDGRWRMVIFDISEDRRTTRDMFRNLLKKVGFVQLQGSVWVYPYDCEEVVKLIKTDQHLGKQVIYSIVDVLENDTWLRRHFKLRMR